MKRVAIVLTLDEERHLARCLASLAGVVDEVLVVDSGSSDRTEDIAREQGARFLQHDFVNQARQFNWALTQLDTDTDWVLRIDADEYLTPALASEIRERLPRLDAGVDGVVFGRGMVFQGRKLRFGGLFPVRVLRLFRYGRGRCEERWMDEHIQVAGPTVNFSGELIDHNLQSLSWWTDKHNRYASREAVELLNLKHGFLLSADTAGQSAGAQAAAKRWIKERVYARLPGGLRALVYFLYRYVVRLGFLDGRAGVTFHVLQGFWYRYLVDAKVAEVERHMRQQGCDAVQAVEAVLAIRMAH